ncbi:MAG: hypothetical protein IPJ08_11470 [Burkholderiales bacterium]|nr:hypothetical protein [Burkholderiales bacterium]
MPTLPASKEALAALFRSLGARAPEDWVQHVPEDPSSQLARYMFLKQAWDSVAQEGDTKWIDEPISRSATNPDEPYAGLGQSLQKILAAGITRDDITELSRCLQAGMLFRIAYLLDGRAYPIDGLEHIDWALFRTDEEGNPTKDQIAGLHESVLETDPTRREMRPRSANSDV